MRSGAVSRTSAIRDRGAALKLTTRPITGELRKAMVTWYAVGMLFCIVAPKNARALLAVLSGGWAVLIDVMIKPDGLFLSPVPVGYLVITALGASIVPFSICLLARTLNWERRMRLIVSFVSAIWHLYGAAIITVGV